MYWRRGNDIYGTSQVIGKIGDDQGIDSFISRCLVVMYDIILSIKLLGGDFVISKKVVNLVYPLR